MRQNFLIFIVLISLTGIYGCRKSDPAIINDPYFGKYNGTLITSINGGVYDSTNAFSQVSGSSKGVIYFSLLNKPELPFFITSSKIIQCDTGYFGSIPQQNIRFINGNNYQVEGNGLNGTHLVFNKNKNTFYCHFTSTHSDTITEIQFLGSKH